MGLACVRCCYLSTRAAYKRERMCVRLRESHMPRSTMMGFMPTSTSSSAANRPAGPAPTITTDGPAARPPTPAAASLSASLAASPAASTPASASAAAAAAALLPRTAATAAASVAAASAATAADVVSEREAILATAAEAMSGEMSETADPADGAAGNNGPPDGDGSSLPWSKSSEKKKKKGGNNVASRTRQRIGDAKRTDRVICGQSSKRAVRKKRRKTAARAENAFVVIALHGKSSRGSSCLILCLA